MSQYDDLIGIPFEYGGRGPDSYDCYGLVMKIHADMGVALPDHKSVADGARIVAMMTGDLHLWRECEIGAGATLLIRVPRSLHVAYCIDDMRMIHSWEGSKMVMIERINTWKHRIVGAYEYVG